MKNKRNKKTVVLSLPKAIFMFAAGAILGCIFIFGVPYLYADVPQGQCRQVETQYDSVEVFYGRSGSKRITLSCSDGEEYSIHDSVIQSENLEKLSSMEKGENISLTLHPLGGGVLELSADDGVIIDFDTSMEILSGQIVGFRYLGIFSYGASLFGLCCMIFDIMLEAGKRNRTTKPNVYSA